MAFSKSEIDHEASMRSGSSALDGTHDLSEAAESSVRPVLQAASDGALRSAAEVTVNEQQPVDQDMGADEAKLLAAPAPWTPPSEEYPGWLEDVLRQQAAMMAPGPVPWTLPSGPYPDWLEDVLRQQAAMLAPAHAVAPPILSPGAEDADSIGYIHAWLDDESQRRGSPYSRGAWLGFLDGIWHGFTDHDAPATGHRLTLPFSAIARTRSAVVTLTRGQVLALLFAILGVVAGLYLAPLTTLIVLLGFVTFAYLLNLTLTAIMATKVIGQPAERRFTREFMSELEGVRWPEYTVLCPLYREANIVPQFVAAMQALDYPRDRLQILFLTELDDELTREAIRSMALPPNFEIITVPDGVPRTKPRACNYGLLLARGSFIVIYDAEDIPDPLQLKKAVLTFASRPSSVACVQAKLGFYNTSQNLLTRWFAIEYALWFNIILPGFQWAGLSLPLGGTSNHFRTDVLRRLGGWDAYNVTEDCDLGLRLAQQHLSTAMLDSATLEEANSDPRNWIRQRSRWIKGYLQTYLVHARRPWEYFIKGRIRQLFSLFAVVGNTPASFLVNPLMWALLGIYVVARNSLTPEFHVLYVLPVFYSAVACLVVGNFLYMFLYLVACVQSEQYALVPWVLTIPASWILLSVAAVMAICQLIVKPHHWEKTHHGLHLSRPAVARHRSESGETAQSLAAVTSKENVYE